MSAAGGSRIEPDQATDQDSDAELAARALRGDRTAFGELACRHRAGVVRLVYRLFRDPDLAEETAQDAFLRAWQRLDTYRPEYSFRNWVYTIAAHLALDQLRRETYTEGTEALEQAASGDGPEREVETKQQSRLVRQAVLALPPASRAVIVLREYEGLSYAEIAGVLDIPLGTVMSRLNYARSQLRQKLALEQEAI